MKKLLAVVLTLAMLASMAIYLPLGVSAVEPGATIMSENFDGIADGTYSWATLKDSLTGWSLLRGDEAAEIFTVSAGVLTIDASASAVDIVLQIAEDARLKENHTLTYDKTQISYEDSAAKTSFSGIYTGTDTGESTKAFIAKTNNEGYAHLALANGSINEGNHSSKGFVQTGSESLNQAHPSVVYYGGGYNKPTSTTTYTTIYDVTNNQVDMYVSGARTLSTAGNPKMASYNVAEYVGEGAYLRVQLGRKTSFDNISIVTGGTTVQDSLSGVVYEQDFTGITYDAETETAQDLADKIGFAMLTENASEGVKYGVTDGKLDILFTAANPADTGGNLSGWSNSQIFGQLYVPGMRYAEETVTIEYDLTYISNGAEGEIANGDSPLWFQIFGRHDGFSAAWGNTQKNWINTRVRISSSDVGTFSQRPEWNKHVSNGTSFAFVNGSYSHSVMNTTDHYKAVLSKTDGFELYINGVLSYRLNADQLESYLAGSGDLFGACKINLRSVKGMHCTLDNIKVELDVVETPSLLITESGANGIQGNGTYEYLEVYNNSDTAVNIYDYAVYTANWSNGTISGATAALDNIILAYPGSHTYKSIKTDEETGASLYSVTHTNPAYAEGWIQPGEVVLLWNTTNAMHNGGYSNPSDITWTSTVDGFRTENKVPEGVKVFMMYNDYNRAFNNSGQYMTGIIERSVFQPGYDPATASGDETLVQAKIDLTAFESYVYVTTKGDGLSKSNNNAERYLGQMVTMPFGSYVYRFNNGGISGGSVEGLAVTNAAADQNPGVVNENQKRKIKIKVDGQTVTMNLGETYDFSVGEGFEKLLFAEIDGVLTGDAADLKIVATSAHEGMVINTTMLALETAPKAYVRLNRNDNAGLRWINAIDGDALAALMADERISDVEVGTLIAKTSELEDYSNELLLDYVTEEDGWDDLVVRKAVATVGSWYNAELGEYEGFNLFSGGIGALYEANYTKDYVARGYVTMNVEGIGQVTIYGAAHTTQAYTILTEAFNDYQNRIETLTPEEQEEYARVAEFMSQVG